MYKLLLVDDEPIIRRGIKSLANLHDIGISEVFEAQNGLEAIETTKLKKPDIIIMDINMPDMDGLSASAMIKQEFPEVFIIILTGYDYFEYAQNAIRAKVDDYILKPVSKTDIEHILVKIIKLLNQRKSEREIQKLSHEIHFMQPLAKDDGEEKNAHDSNQQDLSNSIQTYLLEHIFDPELSLNKMATDIACNSSYLSVLIKQNYGLSFQDYVNKKRMEKAKLLLLSTNMKNYEIAEQIGIEDVNYFITKFKKTWGITPKQYRQGIVSKEEQGE